MSRWFVAIVLAVAAIWYIQAPPRDVDDYREQAGETTGALISNLATAGIWIRGVADDRVTREAATVGLEDAERTAVATAADFDDLDPPAGADPLRAQVSELADAATEELGALRRHAHEEQWGAVAAGRGAIEDVLARLEKLAEELPE